MWEIFMPHPVLPRALCELEYTAVVAVSALHSNAC